MQFFTIAVKIFVVLAIMNCLKPWNSYVWWCHKFWSVWFIKKTKKKLISQEWKILLKIKNENSIYLHVFARICCLTEVCLISRKYGKSQSFEVIQSWCYWNYLLSLFFRKSLVSLTDIKIGYSGKQRQRPILQKRTPLNLCFSIKFKF